MELTDQEIKEIANKLDAGMVCFYNKLSRQIKYILNINKWLDLDEEFWAKELKEIHDHSDEYLAFENMPSKEYFNLMSNFAENLDNSYLQKRLAKVLNKQNSFSKFKNQIEKSDTYRQKWCEYKTLRYIECTKEQLDAQNMISHKY